MWELDVGVWNIYTIVLWNLYTSMIFRVAFYSYNRTDFWTAAFSVLFVLYMPKQETTAKPFWSA